MTMGPRGGVSLPGLALSGLLVCFALAACAATPAPTLADRPEVRGFIDDMVAHHDFKEGDLTRMFRQVKRRQDVLDAMSRPAERKPWYLYRPIFLTERRIAGGVEFWTANREALERAHDVFGVPPEIVTAIIGVETFYGRHTGRYRVLDSLATLAFDYPPRGEFFRGELEQFLLLAREEQLDPLEVTGSYAGAMGVPQFIASSYRSYAIDFAGDGHRNLMTNVTDAIGSVANYFKLHDWQPGEPVASRAAVEDRDYGAVLDMGLKPHTALRDFAAMGIHAEETVPEDRPAALLRLDAAEGSQEYWLAFNNFYVITRYNHSPLYAMAVYQLAEEIRSRYRTRTAKNE
jgi:membrane-bound lytic murein transglycosylase B